MTTVGVTGGLGFLGWHIRARFLARGITTLPATRSTFAEPDRLDEFVRACDCILHVAGVNRAFSDADLVDGNIGPAGALVQALQRTGRSVPIAYTNSTHADGDSPYGMAKAEAASILRDWAATAGAPFLDLVIPHVFGEYGQPRYNSAIATFAHCLATGENVEVNRDGRLELVHAQTVAERMVDFVAHPAGGRERITGRPTSVGEAWDLLQRQHCRYCTQLTVPAFADGFELQMFNTLRSQLYRTDHYPVPLTLHSDSRGAFAELARADGIGQTSISTSHPGVVRGDHFHFDKIERFVVVAGEAEIRIRRVLTDEVQAFTVSGSEPVAIDMPTLATHRIINTGPNTLTTVFWSGDHFDADRPDTFADPVDRSMQGSA